jgi:hypothetical protein
MACLAAPSRQEGNAALEAAAVGGGGELTPAGALQPAAPSARPNAMTVTPSVDRNADINVDPNDDFDIGPSVAPNLDRNLAPNLAPHENPQVAPPATRIDPAACSGHSGSRLERIQPPFPLPNSTTRGR